MTYWCGPSYKHVPCCSRAWLAYPDKLQCCQKMKRVEEGSLGGDYFQGLCLKPHQCVLHFNDETVTEIRSLSSTAPMPLTTGTQGARVPSWV